MQLPKQHNHPLCNAYNHKPDIFAKELADMLNDTEAYLKRVGTDGLLRLVGSYLVHHIESKGMRSADGSYITVQCPYDRATPYTFKVVVLTRYTQSFIERRGVTHKRYTASDAIRDAEIHAHHFHVLLNVVGISSLVTIGMSDLHDLSGYQRGDWYKVDLYFTLFDEKNMVYDSAAAELVSQNTFRGESPNE